ncbi:Fe(3+)-hydroxamate ABC transporter permease FhuB [Psychrobacter pygoscelis]|uniref:Fe(3+)-hydroxamate ABC transporter permease FhuB n=1 Tax=Psychrobacter pygoscelis TaxID=2488563 RepID=UPI001F60D80F|nr:Fe(3+)-hydroxamate ABC transporter permease FhuB [Psychrobacter pygoscelis]
MSKKIVVLLVMLILALVSSYAVVTQLWHWPISKLWQASTQLPIEMMAIQLQIVPTMWIAIVAGGLLGVVSVLLQQLVKNSLASDTTLGVGSGAQIALLIVTLFFPSFGIYGSFWVAFVGALLSMGLVFALAAPSRMNPLVLVLGGLVVNILLAAMAGLLLIFFSEKALGVMTWGAGSLLQSSWQSSQQLTLAAALLGLGILPLLKPLTLMSLDDRQASSMGVPVATIRIIVVVMVALATALVVSRLGMLSFIGLGAATLVNVLNISKLSHRLLSGFSLGALLLWITSNVVTLIEQSVSIPVPAGAMTGVLGAPLIIWLIMRQRRQHNESVTPMLVAKRRRVAWQGIAAGLIVLVVAAVLIAPTLSGWQVMLDSRILTEFRLPRTLSAAATGVMLATAGVLLQTLTRNPMASPEVLGISSGAALGVLLAFILLPAIGISMGMGTMVLAGGAGAVLVLLLILWLARRLDPAYLLLVGIAVAALMSGILNIIKLTGDPRLQAMLSWLSGTTYSARPETAWWLMSCAVVLFVASMLLIKPLRLLGLGETVARSLGVTVKLTELMILVVVAGLSAASTLAVGPLSFVGLMIPHLATSLGAVQLERQLPLAALLGAGLMIIADWIGRYIIFPYEIPAGTIAAVIGGAYFLYLMRRIRA